QDGTDAGDKSSGQRDLPSALSIAAHNQPGIRVIGPPHRAAVELCCLHLQQAVHYALLHGLGKIINLFPDGFGKMALDEFRLVGGGQFFERGLRGTGLQAGGRQRGQIHKSYKNPTESHGRTWIQQQTPETVRWFRSAYARWNERGTQFLQEKKREKN